MGIVETDDKKIKSMKGLHIYHAGISNCSMRVRITAEEKNLDWDSHIINLRKQENLEDWYLKINPKGLVPAIIDDGVIVTESNDIMLYLEEKYPKPRLLPEDPQEAEEVKRWVNLASEVHLRTIKTYVYGSIGGASKKKSDMERYRQIQPDKELVEFHEKSLEGLPEGEVKRAAEQIHQIFAEIDEELKNQKWIVGKNVSLADIAWIPQFAILEILGFSFSKYKNVQKWAKEFQKRLSYKNGIAKWLPKVPAWVIRIFLRIKKLFS
jgi:glutathione S-transferase